MTLDAPELTAAVLMKNNPSRRDAEIAAWNEARKHEKGSGPHAYWVAVTVSLVDGTEMPTVDDDFGRRVRTYRTRIGAGMRA